MGRAALGSSSMAVLRFVLESSPAIQLHGLDIFDRRYVGTKVNGHESRKACLKALLARGAKLGPANNVPSSKLLRKLECESFQSWVDRYFKSMACARMDMPDNLRERICAFLGGIPP